MNVCARSERDDNMSPLAYERAPQQQILRCCRPLIRTRHVLRRAANAVNALQG